MAKKEIETVIETATEKPATVTVVIPIDPLNKGDKIVPVCLDSKKQHIEMQITRGVPTEVPIEVYEVLKNAGYITGQA